MQPVQAFFELLDKRGTPDAETEHIGRWISPNASRARGSRAPPARGRRSARRATTMREARRHTKAGATAKASLAAGDRRRRKAGA